MNISDTGIRRVAVVGTGTVGASWTALFLGCGLDVAATDPAPGAGGRLEAAVEAIRPVLARLGLRGQGRLTFRDGPEEAVRDADFVQENAPERLDLKIDLLARLDRAAPKGALIASSTSSLLRSRMVRDCADPGRVVIAHPFNPPHLVPLVELVGEPDACRRAAEFYAAIGKRPVILNREATGHIANRLTAALWREALYIVEQGIADVEDVDAAITAGPGLRWAVMGPFMTYHLGGGAGGIAHYLDHLGPSQMHRWNDLGTPTVDEDLKRQVVGGVDREAAGRTIGQLEQERDRALLAILGTRAPDGS
ncbi:3-hydroxyacyl-CoA dehydrogenase (plasmid) [Skermanella mucosa]|uniref:3-hydroxyacyl-CoA dehydrogenase NAD-binding domain-containing protein n=1 Tax=Skermanella mucosa TaxID=1789672 RepID=UPI001B3BD5B4|nr:3-hydroxyacyl-CoA dehydrogenase NAD-binding domain-containing protein [Skermanella mucosa]UEM24719.1 3-hydroxyacyl-CoA dehydrogenase [Skermanella mucosa]